MFRSHRATIVDRQTKWDRGPFRIDEIVVRHEVDGTVLPDKPYVSFERGEAVAALLVNSDTRSVILVRQYRPCTVGDDPNGGNLIETAAGIIRNNETPEQCLKREIHEETGYVLAFDAATGKLKNVEFIADFFPSPGACSERIKLYYVEVNASTDYQPDTAHVTTPSPDDTRSPEAIPPPDSYEFVETIVFGFDEFFARVENREFTDSKILIAAYWLKDRIRNRQIGWVLDNPKVKAPQFDIMAAPGKSIGYRVGDIGANNDIDIWVNSENTQFFMDRIYGSTLSARIRTLGAKIEDKKLLDDTIQKSLNTSLMIGSGMTLGNVLHTTAGQLTHSHKVRRLIHAAVVEPGNLDSEIPTLVTNPTAIKNCVWAALKLCDELNARWRLPWSKPYTSIIFPLLGAGAGGLNSEIVAGHIIPLAVDYLEQHKSSKLTNVYFLAYTPKEIEICDRIMSRLDGLSRKAN